MATPPAPGRYVTDKGGRYRLAALDDFITFRDAVTAEDASWTHKFSNETVRVYTKPGPAGEPGEGLNMIKLVAQFPTVCPETLFDVVFDNVYRKTWDEYMIDSRELKRLDRRTCLWYYACKFPFPMSNRDFLTQCYWAEFTNGDFVIVNHSADHASAPESKKFIRGTSLRTGHYFQKMPHGRGCTLYYTSHSDPKGSIPHVVLNSVLTSTVPSMMESMKKNGEGYELWISDTQGSRYVKDWRTPKINWDGSVDPAAAEDDLSSQCIDGAMSDPDDDDASFEAGASPRARGSGSRHVRRRSEVARQQRRNVHDASGDKAVVLAPVAPRVGSDPIAVQQYRAVMDDACRLVDTQFLTEGNAPTLEEYLMRLTAVVTGMRRIEIPDEDDEDDEELA